MGSLPIFLFPSLRKSWSLIPQSIPFLPPVCPFTYAYKFPLFPIPLSSRELGVVVAVPGEDTGGLGFSLNRGLVSFPRMRSACT